MTGQLTSWPEIASGICDEQLHHALSASLFRRLKPTSRVTMSVSPGFYVAWHLHFGHCAQPASRISLSTSVDKFRGSPTLAAKHLTCATGGESFQADVVL